jgi:hypothetical protein
LNNGVIGQFFSGDTPHRPQHPRLELLHRRPARVYKGSDIQFDAVFNKVGYHYPAQRILTLWADAVPDDQQAEPPEPLVMRLNTFDCAVYSQTNLIPKDYELDDFEVRTPTDIMASTSTCRSGTSPPPTARGQRWNYEMARSRPARCASASMPSARSTVQG